MKCITDRAYQVKIKFINFSGGFIAAAIGLSVDHSVIILQYFTSYAWLDQGVSYLDQIDYSDYIDYICSLVSAF